jgi:intracellular septation protein
MQFLYDFFPIIIFFIAYKIAGIYAATAIAILVSFIQVSLFWFRHRKFQKMQLITFIMILFLGGATLILHKPIYIKWKPSIVYWIFALVFLGSHLVGKKPLVRYMMDKKISLPENIWKQLNFIWALFFATMGFANIYVVYHYNTNIWVNFKLFGILGLTVIFVVIQAIYLSRHIKVDKPKKN